MGTIRRTPHYFIEFIRNGETMVNAMTEITPAMFTANIDTLFYLPSTTIIHKMFCLYGKGCFNKRQGHMKIVIDRANKNALLKFPSGFLRLRSVAVNLRSIIL